MTPLERYRILAAYLVMKIEERDWHGVADAAMDLREMEARHPKLRSESLEEGEPARVA